MEPRDGTDGSPTAGRAVTGCDRRAQLDERSGGRRGRRATYRSASRARSLVRSWRALTRLTVAERERIDTDSVVARRPS